MNSQKCHLEEKNTLTSADLRIDATFDRVQCYEDESHDKKFLLKCKTCGAFYFYCFHEDIDWQGGNDPQFSRFVQLGWISEEQALTQAQRMAGLDIQGLDQFVPRIAKDYPSAADEPYICWVR